MPIISLLLPLALLAAQDAAPKRIAIYFGDDSSEYARDGECDDVRFLGQGMAAAEALSVTQIARDRTDCLALIKRGMIRFNPLFADPATPADIDYGDDASDYADDGECDDVRFAGAYSAEMYYMVEHIGHDATDCRAAMENGTARWQGDGRDMDYGVTE